MKFGQLIECNQSNAKNISHVVMNCFRPETAPLKAKIHLHFKMTREKMILYTLKKCHFLLKINANLGGGNFNPHPPSSLLTS